MILIKILIFDKLILMDDVSGLADKSEDFVNCLTMSQKFNFTFIYVSHTMYPTRYNWHMILSQTKLLIFSQGSLQTSSVRKILPSYCNRYTNKYFPHRDLWLNRLYFEILNSSEKKILTINIRDKRAIKI